MPAAGPQIMTRIGATCLITIGVWCVIELAVQFGYYRHQCHLGEGARQASLLCVCALANACPHTLCSRAMFGQLTTLTPKPEASGF